MKMSSIIPGILIIAAIGLGYGGAVESFQYSAPFDNAGAEKTSSDQAHGGEHVAVRADEESIGKGKALFEKFCSRCHNVDSSVPHSAIPLRGPGLKGILKNDVMPVSKRPASAENILNQLNGSLRDMPSFHFLSEEMKLNIIAYLNTL